MRSIDALLVSLQPQLKTCTFIFNTSFTKNRHSNFRLGSFLKRKWTGFCESRNSHVPQIAPTYRTVLYLKVEQTRMWFRCLFPEIHRITNKIGSPSTKTTFVWVIWKYSKRNLSISPLRIIITVLYSKIWGICGMHEGIGQVTYHFPQYRPIFIRKNVHP